MTREDDMHGRLIYSLRQRSSMEDSYADGRKDIFGKRQERIKEGRGAPRALSLRSSFSLSFQLISKAIVKP